MSKTFLIQTIQFSISTQFSSIWPIDIALSGATIPDQNGPGSDDNERVLRIPQSSSITGASPSDCFVPYPIQGTRCEGGVLPFYRGAVGVFYCPSQMGLASLCVCEWVFSPLCRDEVGVFYSPIQLGIFVIVVVYSS